MVACGVFRMRLPLPGSPQDAVLAPLLGQGLAVGLQVVALPARTQVLRGRAAASEKDCQHVFTLNKWHRVLEDTYLTKPPNAAMSCRFPL